MSRYRSPLVSTVEPATRIVVGKIVPQSEEQVKVTVVGIQGPTGPQGPIGPAGSEAPIDDSSVSSATVWSSEKIASEIERLNVDFIGSSWTEVVLNEEYTMTIPHTLGVKPASVRVEDSNNDEVEVDINTPDAATVILTSSIFFSGTVYISKI